MKASEIREVSTQELVTKLDDARQELMNLRFQMAMGGLKDYTRLRITRKNIARLSTILAEREALATEKGEA
ncbi:MAG: 50S ribosomal protein L29 [Anaerolineales bacterium]|nr:50S ribosomal protein L29 [Anaerolineales bacterium]